MKAYCAKLTPEQRKVRTKAANEAIRGIIRDEEFGRKVSAGKIGKKHGPESEEWRRNISKYRSGSHWHLENGKRVWVLKEASEA